MRHIRNFVILGAIFISILLLTLYISSVIFTALVYGPAYISLNLQMIWDFLVVRGFWFWWVYRAQLPLDANEFFIPKLLFSVIVPFGTLSAMGYIFRAPILDYRPFKAKEALHGTARWASESEVKKAGLRSKEGMLMGKDKKGFYVAGGYQHALLFAPTGSGKGVGFVIPNLLFWKDSVIVHDIKLENHEITSGWRAKQGQKVFVWSPAEPDGITHCYNPIDWVSKKPGQMVDDVQKIANLILPEKEFWNNEARSLFVGVVLYLLAVPEKIKSFGEVVRTMRSDDVVYNLAVVLDTIGKQIHPVAYMNIAAFLQKADKERSGVISTLNSGLELWANPLIDTATATSDFNIQMFKRERTTVYVGLTPDNIQRLEPLMQVFYQQASEFLSRKIPKKEEEPYGVLFMLDEFPTLGKMEQFLSGIAYFRGYNVRLFLIIQDTQQLKGTYEEPGMNTFLSNSTYRITFSANNIETAKLISELCGNKTVEQASQSKPKFLDLNPASRSLNVSDVSRALLLPQEVITLPRDDQIVLVEACNPIRSKKIKYYADPFFLKRLLPPTPIPVQEPFDVRKFDDSGVVVEDSEMPPPPPPPPPLESQDDPMLDMDYEPDDDPHYDPDNEPDYDPEDFDPEDFNSEELDPEDFEQEDFIEPEEQDKNGKSD
jgi:type IV secretion system protein VirD4